MIFLGELLTGEVKARCISVLQELVAEHQGRRDQATDETVSKFWEIRKLEFDYPDPPKIEVKSGKKEKKRGGGKNQKN